MYSIPISLGDNYLYLVLVIKDNPIKSEMTVILDLLAYHIVNEYNLSNLTCNVSLNNKQIRILKLLARGITEKAIAIETGLCIDTIKYHKKNILKKLDSTSTIEAVIKSIKFNIIKVNEINI
ncbi:helix-turn-helix transcriptional regulator [Clostridium sp. M14]|uniref:helix-turn-helix transcriptional regulator n=1 Tax=Clostridium sp. M14 TaxID=2716311 RepID=UPI0013EECAB2|nr:helix-turn-helix transcriptional regulator [Clostridium sp. M14]MBZ9693479.1 helix-turn-helix transcriptional regulator [Clostridium sp. M14]